MCSSSDLVTFYARKLKFNMLPTPRPIIQRYARVAPGACPGVGLGVKMYNWSDFILTFMPVFLLVVIT